MSGHAGVCKICGRSLAVKRYSPVYCSPDCKIEGIRRRNKASRAAVAVLSPRPCTDCGELFTPQDARNKLCPKCQAALGGRRAEKKPVNGYTPRHTEPGRVCHDCGTPTPDYRCQKCRDAWRRKHCVEGAA